MEKAMLPFLVAKFHVGVAIEQVSSKDGSQGL
jgi:hypothetical protein